VLAKNANRQASLQKPDRVADQLLKAARNIVRHIRQLQLPKPLLISILLALILSIGVGALWSIFKWYRLQKAPQSHSSHILASGERWKITQSNGNKRVYQASIDSISIERAKLGPFAIGPLHVAHLNRVAIDFYAEGLADRISSQSGTFGIDILENSLADIKNDGFFRSRKIKILDIKDISLNLWDREKQVFGISSDQATVDRQTGDILFIGHASLHAAENGNIISHRIRWIRKTSLFRINDPFIWTKGAITKEGRELETDYLLQKVTYQIKS
jgi:hypothetical protein